MWEWGNSITDVPGVRVGSAEDTEALTGCTVALFEHGAVAGVDVRGSAPGTREIEAIKPVRKVEKIHGILLTGGSAYGLDAAGGVQKYLEEQGIGYDVQVAKIPIIPTAVIFDLRVGSPNVRPGIDMGYEAAKNAADTEPQTGLHGVGIGASSGGISGDKKGRGGLGSASLKLDNNISVGALVVTNSFGNVINPHTNELLVGSLNRDEWKLPKNVESFLENTVLAVVATNCKLNKEEATKVAQMAQDGIARTIIPSHTMYDGDIVFAVSTGNSEGNVNLIGDAAAEVVIRSILKGVSISNGISLDSIK